jgi:chromosomal replication initiation ATPase DnaA
LLIVADVPPPQWKVTLPDLRSRLAATPHLEIGPPDDALIGQLIVKLLGDRGIAAPPELGPYLVPRIERSYVSVLMVVDILDRVMLSHHRRMTVPLAKRALDEAGLIERARKTG